MRVTYIREMNKWIATGKFDGITILAYEPTRIEASCAWLELAVEQAKANVAFLQSTMKPDLRVVE